VLSDLIRVKRRVNLSPTVVFLTGVDCGLELMWKIKRGFMYFHIAKSVQPFFRLLLERFFIFLK